MNDLLQPMARMIRDDKQQAEATHDIAKQAAVLGIVDGLDENAKTLAKRYRDLTPRQMDGFFKMAAKSTDSEKASGDALPEDLFGAFLDASMSQVLMSPRIQKAMLSLREGMATNGMSCQAIDKALDAMRRENVGEFLARLDDVFEQVDVSTAPLFEARAKISEALKDGQSTQAKPWPDSSEDRLESLLRDLDQHGILPDAAVIIASVPASS